MRKDLIGLAVVLSFSIVLSIRALSQASGQTPANATSTAPSYDPHNLNGTWIVRGGGGGQSQDLAPVTVRTEWMRAPLPLTPDGLALLKTRKGGKGPRGVAPSQANDPIGDANPPGLPRTFLLGQYRIQFITLPTETVNLFEWYHMWRQIWTDGRKLPDEPDSLWYGTSVGKWDGDTFVVDTVGLDPRCWLDEWGAPYSEDLKLTERWGRVDQNTMEFTITVNDPKYYTKVWTSDKRTFRLAKGPDSELKEVIYAPLDEQEFDRRIRDPNTPVSTGSRGNPAQR
jgi:hypothetical protein